MIMTVIINNIMTCPTKMNICFLQCLIKLFLIFYFQFNIFERSKESEIVETNIIRSTKIVCITF